MWVSEFGIYDDMSTKHLAKTMSAMVLQSSIDKPLHKHSYPKLIEDILIFTRLNSIKAIKKDINMESLCNETFHELSEGIEDRNIDFRLNKLLPTKGDQVMIGQLLSNLLSNAIKYTQTREKAIIEVTGKSINGEYIYIVKDNGVGFDMKNYPG